MVTTDTATVIDALRRHATSNRHRTALSHGETTLTYSELNEAVDSVAARLVGANVHPGDRVMLAGENSVGWVVSFLAALRVGAVSVPLNSRLGAAQVPGIVERVEPTLVLYDSSQQHNFIEVAETDHRKVLAIGEGTLDELHQFLSFDDSSVLPSPPAAHMPALLSFTSGTTSAPKGALISHESYFRSAEAWVGPARSSVESTTTVLVPLFHNTGYVDQLAHMILVGGSVDLVRRFRTEAAAAALTQRPPSFLATVPSIFRMLMLHPEAEQMLRRLRAVGLGGSAMVQEWIREANRRWPDLEILHAYGLTEFTSLAHLLPASEFEAHPGSVGPPVRGVRCSIRDSDGAEVPAGAEGEVWLAGPQRMMEYWRAPEATAASIVGPWLRTGDVGFVTDDGYLCLRGRFDDVINRGGEKVTPASLEELLCTCSGVGDAVVIGLPDPVLGERIGAALTLKPESTFDRARVVTHLRGKIADYAIPDEFLVLDQLPLAATGKPDRRAIRAQMIAASATCKPSHVAPGTT